MREVCSERSCMCLHGWAPVVRDGIRCAAGMGHVFRFGLMPMHSAPTRQTRRPQTCSELDVCVQAGHLFACLDRIILVACHAKMCCQRSGVLRAFRPHSGISPAFLGCAPTLLRPVALRHAAHRDVPEAREFRVSAACGCDCQT